MNAKQLPSSLALASFASVQIRETTLVIMNNPDEGSSASVASTYFTGEELLLRSGTIAPCAMAHYFHSFNLKSKRLDGSPASLDAGLFGKYRLPNWITESNEFR